MEYSVVVATRNRLDALALSLPLLLGQTRPPLRDHRGGFERRAGPVRRLVEGIAAGTDDPGAFHRQQPRAPRCSATSASPGPKAR